jgi:hypothetical protein
LADVLAKMEELKDGEEEAMETVAGSYTSPPPLNIPLPATKLPQQSQQAPQQPAASSPPVSYVI